MTAATQYSNELETSFSSLPGWLQAPLRPIYTKMDEGLKIVAGNPDDLVKAGQSYVELGAHLQKLSNQQKADRAKLAGHWHGDAYDAFSRKMANIEQQIDKLGTATAKTNDILTAGAQACVEGANMIIEIIISALAIWLAELAINAALSVLTFGASMLAFVAEAIGNALEALAEILQVVEKVATVLVKIAQIFEKIASLFKEIKAALEAVKLLLETLKALKGAKGIGFLEKQAWNAAHIGAKVAVGQGIKYGTGGHVQIPGVAGTGLKAGEDYKNAWDDTKKAENAAE